MRRASFSLNRQVAKSAKEGILDRIYRMNRIDWGRGKMRRNEAILLFGNSQLFADEFAEGIS